MELNVKDLKTIIIPKCNDFGADTPVCVCASKMQKFHKH